MNTSDKTYFIKKKYNKRTPYFLVLIGALIPCAVFYHKSLTTKKLEDGVKKDIQRIQDKGRKFSDIPKSF